MMERIVLMRKRKLDSWYKQRKETDRGEDVQDNHCHDDTCSAYLALSRSAVFE